MRIASLSAAALCALLAAAPALATGTIHCASPEQNGPRLFLSIGSRPSGIVQARLIDGALELATGPEAGSAQITQSWLDETMIRLDIADANVERYIARLDTRKGGGPAFEGTLAYRDRTWPVRCLRDEDEEG